MLIPHKGHTDTIQVYSVTVMTHVKALQAGHSSLLYRYKAVVGAGMYRYYCLPGTKLPHHESITNIHALFPNNIINWLNLGPINTLERLSLV